MTAIITLPWFPAACHPNHRSRTHWARTRAVKKARGWAVVAARASSLRPPAEGPIRLVATFHPPNGNSRDKDGCLAACKAYFDGIAEAWGVNDARFDPQPAIIAGAVKGGRIEVTIV